MTVSVNGQHRKFQHIWLETNINICSVQWVFHLQHTQKLNQIEWRDKVTRTCINGDRSINNFLDGRSSLCANRLLCVLLSFCYIYGILAASQQQQQNRSDALDKSALNVPLSIFQLRNWKLFRLIHRNRNVRARAAPICSNVSKHVTFHLNWLYTNLIWMDIM